MINEKDKSKRILKYVITMRKYNSQSKCAKEIATALKRSKCTKQCIKDAYLLLGVLLDERKD